MSDRHPHIHRAVLALRRVANAAELQLTDEACHGLARAVMEAIPENKWFVGMTHDCQEERAAAGLREQGFIVYLPKLYTRWQEGRKIDARPALRFTGYILISFDPRLDMHGPISHTAGMDDSCGSALLGGENPTPIAASIIDNLHQLEDEEYFRAKARSKRPARTDLVPGDTVMIGGDRSQPAFGRKGLYFGSERGVASVLEGFAMWKVPEVDLKKVDQEKAA